MTGSRVVAADAIVLAAWVLGLVTIEYVALVLGIIGCITGAIALRRSTKALSALADIGNAQSSSVSDLVETAETLEGRLTDDE